MKRKVKKKMILSPQRRGNVTSLLTTQRKPSPEKKAALKSKIQDILNGRSRFVIRKVSAAGSRRGKVSSSGGRTFSNGQQRVQNPLSVSISNDKVKKDRYDVYTLYPFFKHTAGDKRVWMLKSCRDVVFPSASSSLNTRQKCFFSAGLRSKSLFFLFYCRPDSAVEEGKRRNLEENSEDNKEQNAKEDTEETQRSKKKGKGKKGKKGKARGKKSNREVSEKDKSALKEFLNNLKGTRRLMVRTVSFWILVFSFVSVFYL